MSVRIPEGKGFHPGWFKRRDFNKRTTYRCVDHVKGVNKGCWGPQRRATSLEIKGQREEIILWNSVRTGTVEEEPPRKRGRAGGGKRHAATASQQEGVRNLNFSLF